MILLVGCAVAFADDGALTPIAQAEQSGLPSLGQFTLQPGGPLYALAYTAQQDGWQRIVAAWGAAPNISLRLTGAGPDPITATGNPASLRFEGLAGKQYRIMVDAGTRLQVTSVGALYGGADTGGQPGTGPVETLTPIQLPRTGRDVKVTPTTGPMKTVFSVGGAQSGGSGIMLPSPGGYRVLLDLTKLGIKGGCTVHTNSDDFTGYIELLDYRYSIGSGQTDGLWPNQGGDGTRGVFVPASAFTLVKRVDPTTPALHRALLACANGKAELVVVRAADYSIFARYSFEAAQIVGIRGIGLGATGVPCEEFGLAFQQIRWSTTGGKDQSAPGWDFTKHRPL